MEQPIELKCHKRLLARMRFFSLQLTNRIENLSMPVMIKMEMGKSDECHSRQPKTHAMPTFEGKERLKTEPFLGYTNDAL